MAGARSVGAARKKSSRPGKLAATSAQGSAAAASATKAAQVSSGCAAGLLQHEGEGARVLRDDAAFGGRLAAPARDAVLAELLHSAVRVQHVQRRPRGAEPAQLHRGAAAKEPVEVARPVDWRRLRGAARGRGEDLIAPHRQHAVAVRAVLVGELAQGRLARTLR